MPWNNDRTRYPADWANRRREVIARASGQCEEPGCISAGTEVDHIKNIANGGTHDLNNLRLLCSPCHKQKTVLEAAAGRSRHAAQGYHPREKHPGMVNP
jgi:5-methylcytosine-specific restriction protein A